jgi:EGF-like domain
MFKNKDINDAVWIPLSAILVLLCIVSQIQLISGQAICFNGGMSSNFTIPLNLSLAREYGSATSTNTMIFFAGGATNTGNTGSKVVDIFTYVGPSGIFNHTTALLSVARGGISAATIQVTVGTRTNFYALFAGGIYPSAFTTVDMYNVSSNTWTVDGSGLTQARGFAASAVLGPVAMFAGGERSTSTPLVSSVVDIFNFTTGVPVWSTATLSVARQSLAGAALGNIFFFAGGTDGSGNPSSVVDLYNTATGLWSTTSLPQNTFGNSAGIPNVAISALSPYIFVTGFDGFPTTSPTYLYSPGTNSYITGSHLNYNAVYIGTTATSQYAYFFGGLLTHVTLNTVANVSIFDDTGTLVTNAIMSRPRTNVLGASLPSLGFAFLMGGDSSFTPNTYLSTIDVFSGTSLCTSCGTLSPNQVCNCLPGFLGSQCQTDINECASLPCQNGGVCIDGANSFTCNCTGLPFGGALCQTALIPGTLFFSPFSFFLLFLLFFFLFLLLLS